MDSIIVGSMYHSEHLQRAVYARLMGIENLYMPFRLNQPLLSGISNPESRQPGKTPRFSVNWTAGYDGLEVINTTTGKTEQGEMSRLCPQNFFRHFNKLFGNVPSATSQTVMERPRLYSEAKMTVINYQLTKQNLFKAFQGANLGNWICKPFEQDQFCLTE